MDVEGSLSDFNQQNSHVTDDNAIHYVNRLLENAIANNISDIHIEPIEKHYRIRQRFDGILNTIAKPPPELSSRLTSRLKIMAELDIAEKRLPQDGRLQIKINDNKTIDCRVSSCPTVHGEKIVVRILNQDILNLDIDKLGFHEQQKQIFMDAINQPHGLILVTGPTGSGKTVTLFSALQRLNHESRNIVTIEDPVEIDLPGINQVNINNKAGLSFAKALRAFLRQDPDIIMLGEIRDKETADIAIKAAQTGHLVLATLHTNTTVETITRLLNMDIPHYNLAGTIKLVIAQRLVRVLCQHCKKPQNISAQDLVAFNLSEIQTDTNIVYQAQGCPHCHQGYKNRKAIYELLPINDEINSLILQKENKQIIQAQAQHDGMLSLRAAGLIRVLAGETSLEEMNRVCHD